MCGMQSDEKIKKNQKIVGSLPASCHGAKANPTHDCDLQRQRCKKLRRHKKP
jgi:hypothetical protein